MEGQTLSPKGEIPRPAPRVRFCYVPELTREDGEPSVGPRLMQPASERTTPSREDFEIVMAQTSCREEPPGSSSGGMTGMSLTRLWPSLKMLREISERAEAIFEHG